MGKAYKQGTLLALLLQHQLSETWALMIMILWGWVLFSLFIFKE
jgi:hypothetical protein